LNRTIHTACGERLGHFTEGMCAITQRLQIRASTAGAQPVHRLINGMTFIRL